MLNPGDRVTAEEVRSIQAYKTTLLSIKSDLENIASTERTTAERNILAKIDKALQHAV